jgi:hypothetical protein
MLVKDFTSSFFIFFAYDCLEGTEDFENLKAYYSI